MKLRRSRTLSSRPRPTELDSSDSQIDGSWQVKESFPKLRLIRISKDQRKREKRSNVSSKKTRCWHLSNEVS